jgi:hypothetical protein
MRYTLGTAALALVLAVPLSAQQHGAQAMNDSTAARGPGYCLVGGNYQGMMGNHQAMMGGSHQAMMGGSQQAMMGSGHQNMMGWDHYAMGTMWFWPGRVLALRDSLNLTPDQVQKLQAMAQHGVPESAMQGMHSDTLRMGWMHQEVNSVWNILTPQQRERMTALSSACSTTQWMDGRGMMMGGRRGQRP